MGDAAAGSTAEPVRTELRFRERRLRMRTLDERLTVRLPGLFRAISKRVLRLPMRSRVRQWLVARRTMGGYHAMNRDDIDVLLAIYDESVLVDLRLDERLPPGINGEYRGHEGFREFWAQWLGSWEEFRLEPRNLLDLGDALLVTVDLRGRGRLSGVEMESEVFEVFSISDGAIVRHQDFADEASARRAVGLPPTRPE